MKKVSNLVVIALSAVMLFGCKEKDEEEVPSLSVNPAHREVNFKADGTTNGSDATFTVITNQSTWDAVSDQTWVTIAKTTTGFTLSAAANNTTKAPEPATITVTAGTAPSIEIYAMQDKGFPADGVLINGIIWAKYNVDAKGTFAASPEATGKFYQWNSSTAWSPGNANWPVQTDPAGDTWEAANDPSPAGWRVPTAEDLELLLENMQVSTEWTTQNGVVGQLFTDKTSGNKLFLPAAGRLNRNDGLLSYPSERGYYWSSTKNDDKSALYLRNDNLAVAGYERGYGMMIRCVFVE
jgi:uncharacterized protein (TIGR02145 family)